MVTIQQIQAGLCRYVDNEITSKIMGWQKWVIGAGAAAFAETLPARLREWQENPMTKSLGVIDAQGNVDIDKVRNYFYDQATKSNITVNVPTVGPITFGPNDVDRLAAYIKE